MDIHCPSLSHSVLPLSLYVLLLFQRAGRRHFSRVWLSSLCRQCAGSKLSSESSWQAAENQALRSWWASPMRPHGRWLPAPYTGLAPCPGRCGKSHSRRRRNSHLCPQHVPTQAKVRLRLTSFVPSDTEKVKESLCFSMSLVWMYWMLPEAKSAWLKELILVPGKWTTGGKWATERERQGKTTGSGTYLAIRTLFWLVLIQVRLPREPRDLAGRESTKISFSKRSPGFLWPHPVGSRPPGAEQERSWEKNGPCNTWIVTAGQD